ncbi:MULTISPECIES: hypothetical protein [Haloferax]|uniref:hypothetical protein n=1 Tax=Haloferax TaxID=2251 RepID=UPI001428CE20|nr:MULTISPECIES: hypothetical protein [Haloferax]MDS0242415.1 hypothetical protein [Haloferax sp. S2CR25]MDS0445536.1 hypothetical protein [Haloferax sp. S2CR25-2]
MGHLPYESEEFRGSAGILRDLSGERVRRDELARDELFTESATVAGLSARRRRSDD